MRTQTKQRNHTKTKHEDQHIKLFNNHKKMLKERKVTLKSLHKSEWTMSVQIVSPYGLKIKNSLFLIRFN